jgi:hypothetical protein
LASSTSIETLGMSASILIVSSWSFLFSEMVLPPGLSPSLKGNSFGIFSPCLDVSNETHFLIKKCFFSHQDIRIYSLPAHNLKIQRQKNIKMRQHVKLLSS